MKRKRAHINMQTKLAAALICLLPQEWRDELRERQVPAEDIIGLFEWDHVILHALDGTDKWFNLQPMLRMDHRLKSKRDTAIVAKVKRTNKKWQGFFTAIANGYKPDPQWYGVPRPKKWKPKQKYRWPKRKFPSRKCATITKS